MVPWYQNICATMRGFNIFKQSSWRRANAVSGEVLPSPEAFYFVPHPRTVVGLGALGGAVGGLIEGIHAAKKSKQPRAYMPEDVPLVEQMDLSELPEEVLEHPDWKVARKEGAVVVVPRAAVTSLHTAWWSGIDVVAGDVIFRVSTPIFKRKKMAAYLVDLGWEL
jgi:hypothetical protein